MSPPYVPGSDEEWADVSRAPGRLWVSTHGRVWTTTGPARTTISPHVNTTFKAGRRIAPSGGGYVIVYVPGERKTCAVHILVAEAFLGRRPPKRLACHKDDDKLHNSLKNVYWGTHADNARDTVRNLQRKMAALSWVTASGLAKAGWTASEIDRFLPRPIMASSDPTADLYSYRSRLWRREDVAAATPAREAWKSSETGLSTAELIRDRGWTVIAAERFLPRRPPEYRRSRQPWRFTTEQVLAAEATPEFQVWRRSLQTLRDGRGQQRQLVNAVKELRSRHHTLTEIVAEWHRQDADTTDAQESA